MSRTISVMATPHAAGWTCEVRIEDGARVESDHTVEVTRSDLQRLAPGSTVEDLVRRTFEFLLEREPPQSILLRFRPSDVDRYFPEYARVVRG